MIESPVTESTSSLRRALVPFAIDVVSVLLFVAIGRRSHDESGNVVVGALEVAAPFLIALVVGWLISRAWNAPKSMATGTIVWVCTVVLGLTLRNVVFDRGTAFAFVLVTTITLGLFLLGWRAVAGKFTRTARPDQPVHQ